MKTLSHCFQNDIVTLLAAIEVMSEHRDDHDLLCTLIDELKEKSEKIKVTVGLVKQKLEEKDGKETEDIHRR